MRLDAVNLDRKLGKAAYKARMPALERRAGELQRKCREAGVPVLIVFEGWDAAGKGTLINKLILALDPRGFNVHPVNPPTEDERLRPFLWRFWTKTPARGRIAIFDRSWYGRVLVERVDRIVKKPVWRGAFDDINEFERTLTDDGAVVIKFFLHISKAEQKKRFRGLLRNPATAWKVSREDWRHHKQYARYARAVEEMLARTSKPAARWNVVESHDERFAAVKIFETVIAAMAKRLARRSAPIPRPPPPRRVRGSVLDRTDPKRSLDRKTYERELGRLQERMWDVEHRIYTERIPVIVAFEGWDAAGKGGAIKRLVRSMDPRGYEVVPIAAPNDVEKSHHYLWRFWMHLPKAGHLTVFDRTWYGRVMVERIEGFCAPAEWKRAYGEINEFERQLHKAGAVLVKFWLHMDPAEQLRRFRERERTPYKKWKITDEDWRNREKWGLYKDAVDEMLARTGTAHAPWTVVESGCKLYARIKVIETVVAAVEDALRRQ